MKHDENTRIGRLLSVAYTKWQDATYQALREAGHGELRQSFSPVFRHIDANGTRVADLAIKGNLTKQSMAYLVRSMEDAGYVDVRADPTDRRAKLVALTDKGRAADAALAQMSRKLEGELVKRIGDADVERLRALLEALVAR